MAVLLSQFAGPGAAIQRSGVEDISPATPLRGKRDGWTARSICGPMCFPWHVRNSNGEKKDKPVADG